MKKLILSAFFLLGACDQIGPDALLKKYEWFKNQYEAIQQIDARLKASDLEKTEFRAQSPDMSKWDWHQHESYDRLVATRAGYLSQYNALVAEYNAQSKKFNWEFVKTRDLPHVIEYR